MAHQEFRDMRPMSDPNWGPNRFLIDRERYRSVAGELSELAKQSAEQERIAKADRLKKDVINILQDQFPDVDFSSSLEQ